MKKVLAFFILIVFLPIYTLSAQNINVIIDGKTVSFSESTGYPFIDKGRTMVPLRAAMEAFGAQVSWNPQENTAKVVKDSTTVKCVIGEGCIYRNGVKISNDASAVIASSRTYLPIRAVLEAFGSEVSWDGSVKVKTESGQIISKIEGSGSHVSNIWVAWNAAMKLFESQNYEAAAASFTTLAPDFLALKDINSSAILYHHLGDCYSSLGNYQMASACYLRESDFWAMAGKNDETIDSKRRSNLISTSHRLYIETDDKTYSAGKYFRADYEPSNGIILGAYAEGDSNIHDPYVKDKFYMDTFPSLVGKEHGAYLLYLPYGDDILGYASHLKRAKDLGLILQISLEPHDGLEMVKDNDPYLITLAKNMENSGVKLMLRFAGEMNDTTGQWYTTNYELFKEKFRIVSKIFHIYAPSVPVIWSPNFYPENNIENYYPGDEYVDYVGVSSYKFHQPETDPLGKGVDRSRWSSQLDTIYFLYGDKKPIIISEGSASYMDYNTGEDITDFACKQLYDFYAYLPIKYPNVKMVFIFDSDRERQKFCLSKNQKFLETYKKAISNDSYLDGLNPEKTNNEYYELSNNVTVSAKKADVCSYIQYPDDSAAYVSYFINGESKGSSYEIPYNVNIDFSNYKGQTVKLKADSYSKEGKLLTESKITIKVE